MGTLAVALLSPVDQLGGQLFFMHMIQHKLTIMVAAPLIWLGNPFPIGVWGLPGAGRHAVGAVLNQESPVRAGAGDGHAALRGLDSIRLRLYRLARSRRL